MKKFIILCGLIFCAATAVAQTINWYVDGSVYQTTTCNSGDGITPPTAPAKYGYTFQGWNTAYTPIEYIESTGTQYIDTGYIANFDTYIVSTEAIRSVATAAGTYTGCGADNGGLHFVYDENNIRTGGTTQGIAYEIGNVVVIQNYYNKQRNRVVQIYDETSIGTQGLLPNITITMFGLKNNQGIVSSPGSQRIYSFVIYEGNVIVRDFIPVLDKDGIPCMYDKVSGTFFYNAGTGDFIVGPAVSE